MLLFKRLLTTAVLFVVLLVVFFVVIGGVAGGIAGAKASRQAKAADFQSGYAEGRKAGEEMGRKYGPIIVLSSAGASLVTSVALSFSGALPWCRRRDDDPRSQNVV
jgi:hypothetical protein